MREFVISIGLADQTTHTVKTTTEAAIQTIYNTIGDCTLIQGVGRFTHADGTVVVEPCFRVYVYANADDKTRLVNACEQLKRKLNQETIILSDSPAPETIFV